MQERNSNTLTSKRKKVGRRLSAAILILTLALSHANVYANCKPEPDSFKVCAEELPRNPNFALLCRNGCFLFHPEDEREARFNKERVKLIPELTANIAELERIGVDLKGQRDRALLDVETFKDLFSEAENENARLKRELDEAYSFGDVALYGAAGVVSGVVLTISAAFIGALLL